MITKDQLIDALLSGWNDREQGGRFDTTEETLYDDLTATFGFDFSRDRLEETVLPVAHDRQRYYYQYSTPLYLSGNTGAAADITLIVRMDTPAQTIYLYRIQD